MTTAGRKPLSDTERVRRVVLYLTPDQCRALLADGTLPKRAAETVRRAIDGEPYRNPIRRKTTEE